MSFYDLISERQKILYGRYCLLKNIEECKELYSSLYDFVVLYYYCPKLLHILSIKLRKYECNQLLGDGKIQQLITKSRIMVNGYYVDYARCKHDYTPHTFYYYDDKLQKIIEESILLIDRNLVIGADHIKLLTGRTRYVNRYYINKEECIKDNEVVTLFLYNNLESIAVSCKRINFLDTFGVQYHSDYFNSNRVSVHGYYLSKELCDYYNTNIKVINIASNEELYIKIKDFNKCIGRAYSKDRNVINGFKVLHPSQISHPQSKP